MLSDSDDWIPREECSFHPSRLRRSHRLLRFNVSVKS